ncbi:MAG: hypothetical protein ACRDZO_09210 [Egibacteraceae bacterium]
MTAEESPTTTGGGVAELVACPRPRREGMVAVPFRDPDGYDPQREQRVVIGQPDRDDPLGRIGDLRAAELVLDGDRERALRSRGLSGRRGALDAYTAPDGQQCEREEGQDESCRSHRAAPRSLGGLAIHPRPAIVSGQSVPAAETFPSPSVSSPKDNLSMATLIYLRKV